MYHETCRKATTPTSDDVEKDGGDERPTNGPHDHPTCPPARTGSSRSSPTTLDASSDGDRRVRGHHSNALSNAELLASGFTPPCSLQSHPRRPDPAEVARPESRDIGDQSRMTLAEENAYLKQQINGLQVLPGIIEKKAAECRHWKREAEKANAELAQLRQSSAADAESISALKLQAVLFKEDYDREKQKYDKLKRDYDTILEERNTFLHQMRKYEDDTFQLRYEVSELRARLQKFIIHGNNPAELSPPLSLSSQQTSPVRRPQQQQPQPQAQAAAAAAAVALTSTHDLPVSSYKGWNCTVCTYDNQATRNFCEMCGSLKPKSSSGASRLQTDEPSDY